MGSRQCAQRNMNCMKLRRTEATGNNSMELSFKTAILKTQKISIKAYVRETGCEDGSWTAGSESYPKQVRIL